MRALAVLGDVAGRGPRSEPQRGRRRSDRGLVGVVGVLEVFKMRLAGLLDVERGGSACSGGSGLKPELRVRAEAYQVEMVVIRLAVNEYEVGS